MSAIPRDRVETRLTELTRRRDELTQQLFAFNAVIAELSALLVDEGDDEDEE